MENNYLKKETPTWLDKKIEKLYNEKGSMTIDSILNSISDIDLKTENDVTDDLLPTPTFNNEIMEKLETKTDKLERIDSDHSLSITQGIDKLVSLTQPDKIASEEKFFNYLRKAIQS